jgi:hypothetical protein
MTDDDFESTDDLFYSRLIFVRALDALLPPGKGVFVDLNGLALHMGFDKVIVHNNPYTNEIGVIKADERTDLKNGDRVTIVNEDIIKN